MEDYKKTSKKRLVKELSVAKSESGCPVGIRIKPSKNLYEWTGEVDGPEGTPYEQGTFRFSLTFPLDYPFVPPKVKCLHKVYHCNINSIGNVCLNVLKDQWSPLLTATSLLVCIQQLLAEPNPDDPLMPSVANEFRDNRALHDKKARLFTLKFAKKS